MTTPLTNKPKITQIDINNGYVTRYFVRNVSTKVVTEVDKKQYDTFKQNTLYETVDFPWVITGLANDVIATDGKIIYGTKHKNTVTTQFYDKKLPGLTRLLNNPLEYFQGTRNPELVVPTSQPTYNSDVAGSGTGRTIDNFIRTPPTSSTPVQNTILYAWGGWESFIVPNAYDNLGIGMTTINEPTPTQVGSESTWIDVQSQISSTVGLKSDGTLWGWGDNITDFFPSPLIGLLGLGSVVSGSNTPIQIGSGNTWTAIAVGERHFVALKADGTIWSTGRNNRGQLGLGDTTDRDTLTQVGSDSNWVKIFAGPENIMAIKSNGTLWGAGYNFDGQLGLGDTSDRVSLTQISSDSWNMVSLNDAYTMAIKSDGTMWACGNGSGDKPQMGLGENDLDILTFTQVGSDSDWSFVDGGSSHTFAIKTNGTLWGTGYNLEGQLGLGDLVNRNTFTQIGSDTWTYADAGNYASFGIKPDGTLWSWGFQNDPSSQFGGRLGQGDYVDRNTPTQIGTSTSWIRVRAGNSYNNYAIFGIKSVST